MEEILVKDLNLITGIDERKIAISFISGILIEDLMRKHNAINDLNEYIIKNDFFGIILFGFKDNSKCDFGIFFPSSDLLRKICERFCSSDELNFELLFELPGFICYKGNIRISKNEILSIINNVISAHRDYLQTSKGDYDQEFIQTSTSSDMDRSSESLSFKDSGIIDSNSRESISYSEVTNYQGKNYNRINNNLVLKGNQEKYSIPFDSMNVYGSYIDDSYVGEFTGEINSSYIENSQGKDSFWQNQDKFDQVLEFSFDSFGPESLLFPRQIQGNDDLNGESEQNVRGKKANEISSIHLSEDKIKNQIPEYNLQANEILNTSRNLNEDKSNNFNNSNGIVNELSIDKSKIKEVKSNLDERNDKQILVLQASDDNDEKENSNPAFQRTPLTQSQRRKIHTQMKVNEIFASLDDQVEAAMEMKNEPIINNFMLDNKQEFVLVKDIEQGTLKRQPSIIKKKILVNQDLLSNDEIQIPQTKTKSVSFSTTEAHEIKDLQHDEYEENRWGESCPIGRRGEVKRIDLKVIEPYKKVLSHGGYFHHYSTAQLSRTNIEETTGPTVVIFSACYLPDRSRKDYNYVMENLFMYVLTTLNELVADDYILVYFHNAGCSGVSCNNMPTFGWLKRCYTMIDRRLRKNLRSLLLVHPTFWLKTFVLMTKPFISSKFARKLRFVSSLTELNDIVPIDTAIIPPPVKQYDELCCVDDDEVEMDRINRQKKKSSRF